jgi:large subunit ribosomal protein L9
MEIILKQDVPNLGLKDDMVKVKDGYANNYLIPKGYAVTGNVIGEEGTCREHEAESS